MSGGSWMAALANRSGRCDDQIERDDRPEGAADDMRGRNPETIDQRCKVAHVVADAALRREPLALAVTSTIVGRDAAAARQQRDHAVPVVMVAPGTVNEDDRRSGTAARLEVEIDAVETRLHDVPPAAAAWQSGQEGLLAASSPGVGGAGAPSVTAMRLLTRSNSKAHDGNGRSAGSQLKLCVVHMSDVEELLQSPHRGDVCSGRRRDEIQRRADRCA